MENQQSISRNLIWPCFFHPKIFKDFQDPDIRLWHRDKCFTYKTEYLRLVDVAVIHMIYHVNKWMLRLHRQPATHLAAAFNNAALISSSMAFLLSWLSGWKVSRWNKMCSIFLWANLSQTIPSEPCDTPAARSHWLCMKTGAVIVTSSTGLW